MTLKFLEKRLFDFAGRSRTMAEALSFSADKKNSQKIAIDTLIDLGADWMGLDDLETEGGRYISQHRKVVAFYRRKKLGEMAKDTCGDMGQVRSETGARLPKL